MRRSNQPRLPRDSMGQVLALAGLLLVAAIGLVGPSGVLAWSDNRRLLSERKGEVEKLAAERDELKNRVDLLDPREADPDLVGELLRDKLNVAHPDEIVLTRP